MPEALLAPAKLARVRSRFFARLKQQRGDAPPGAPDLSSILEFMSVAGECTAELNQAAGLTGTLGSVVRYGVMQSAFPAFVTFRRGNPRRACDLVIDAWETNARLYGSRLYDSFCRKEKIKATLCAPVYSGGELVGVIQLPAGQEEGELLGLWNLAVFEELIGGPKAVVGRLFIQRLMTHLSLSQDELGRMLGVAGETIRRWKNGVTPIPESRLAELTAAEGPLNRLLHIFRPERLPLAIRRKAELFGGKRALDWILDGRIAEVADRYELSLAYQA